MSLGAGAVSTGFCVSVGWPVTSPGREDMPGSLDVPWSPVVLGAAGREMLPELPWSLELPVALPLVSLPLVVPELVEPELEPPMVPLEPELVPSEPLLFASLPEVVESGAAGVVGLVFVSSAAGVSDGDVRVRCMELVSLELRPCPLCLCFLCFFCTGVLVASSLVPDEVVPLTAESSLSLSLSVALVLEELSLPMPVVVELEPVEGFALEESSLLDELVSDGRVVFEVDVSELGVELLEGLLLGRVLLLLAVLDELPGSALLF